MCFQKLSKGFKKGMHLPVLLRCLSVNWANGFHWVKFVAYKIMNVVQIGTFVAQLREEYLLLIC